MKERAGKLTNRIAVFRAERKMTQKDLAEKVGVSRQTIISIENSKYTPSLALAFEIAYVFEAEINEVFQYNQFKEGL